MAMSGEQFVEWLDRELEPFRREASASIYFEAVVQRQVEQGASF